MKEISIIILEVILGILVIMYLRDLLKPLK